MRWDLEYVLRGDEKVYNLSNLKIGDVIKVKCTGGWIPDVKKIKGKIVTGDPREFRITGFNEGIKLEPVKK